MSLFTKRYCYINVILPLPLRNALFTYKYEGEEARERDKSLVGRLVLVPFGTRKTYTALIVEQLQENPPAHLNIESIKSAIHLLPYAPIPSSTLQLWKWVSEYYLCNMGDVFRAAVPSVFRPDSEQKYTFREDSSPLLSEDVITFKEKQKRGFTLRELQRAFPDIYTDIFTTLLDQDAITLGGGVDSFYQPTKIKLWKITLPISLIQEEREENKALFLASFSKKNKLHQVLSRILEGDSLHGKSFSSIQELSDTLQISNYTFNQLRSLGFVVKVEVEQSPLPPAPFPSEQRVLYKEDSTTSQLDFQGKQTLLLDAPYSSLLERIPWRSLSEIVREEGQHLLLFPTHEALSLALPTLQNLIQSPIHLYSSTNSTSLKYKTWQHALLGTSGLYIGLRSAGWLPLKRLASTTIIDEEHPQYRQVDPAPRYTAPNIALRQAQLTNTRTLLVSATPSVERHLHALRNQKYTYSKKPPIRPLPPIEVVDMNKAFEQNRVKGRILSFELLQAIHTTLLNQGNILLIYQRQGYAKYLICPACQHSPSCPTCQTPLRSHKRLGNTHILTCPKCKHQKEIQDTCPQCHHASLQPVGTGIERLAQSLRNLFPQTPIFLNEEAKYWKGRSHKDNTSTNTPCIQLCTDHTPSISLLASSALVGIVQADLMLSFSSFRTTEQTHQLLHYYASEATRAKGIIIQFFNHKSIALTALQAQKPELFYEKELEERHLINLPPFSRMLDVLIEIANDQTALEYSAIFKGHLSLLFPNLRILGPSPLPLHRKKQHTGYRLTLLIPLNQPLSPLRSELFKLQDSLKKNHRGSQLNIFFEMDPL